MKNFYHVFSKGDNARNLVICRNDFSFIFNRIAVCSFLSDVDILAFSIEETHLHFLICCSADQCKMFCDRMESCIKLHICRNRKSLDGVKFKLKSEMIEDKNYLMSVAGYVTVQATKDGKGIMPYDYIWGTGSMYFRRQEHVPIWETANNGQRLPVKEFRSLTWREKHAICGSAKELPPWWRICNGLILPDNYVDVKAFENIFGSANSFRVCGAASRKALQEVDARIANIQGINIDDMEAREICRNICIKKFGTEDVRMLSPDQRMRLAMELRRNQGFSIRQIATLARISEDDVRDFC